MNRLRFLYCLLIIPFYSIPLAADAQSLFLQTIYGSTRIDEPVLIELINSKAMQRLKKINQYGVMKFLNPEQEYTRYEHSMGVLFLMRHFGASIDAQIVGLLHDVSHTAFSHVADYLFDTVQNKSSYQDSIFEWYVENTDVLPILRKYSFDWIYPANVRDSYIMLKDSLPHLCADRLEYNLYGGYIEGWLSQEEVQEIVRHIHYKNAQWIFDDVQYARIFADVTIALSENIWCAAWNGFVFTKTAQMLKRALEINCITMDDLIFSYDEKVWQMLQSCQDIKVKKDIAAILHYKEHFCLGSLEDHDIYIKGKFRGVDPLVQTRVGTKTLSEIDEEFKMLYVQAKETLNKGWYIKEIV